MKKFLTIIKVSGITAEEMPGLREKEGAIMMQYQKSGNLIFAAARKDLSGAYLVFLATDLEHTQKMLESLPMYPYMTIEIVELLNEQ